MWRNLIILANSRKQKNRCIVGIDIESGEWIRPVYQDGKSGIPWEIRNINGQEPQLLDIISIPLDKDGPHRDIQPENRQLLEGKWKLVGKANINHLKTYIKKDGFIFYNTDEKIHINDLQRLPVRQSVCLIEAKVTFSASSYVDGRKRVNGKFKFWGDEYTLPVTDYDFWSKFPENYTGYANCLLTITLGLPFTDNFCYKFIAGIILLDELKLN